DLFRGRRGDRSGRLTPLDRNRAARRQAARARQAQETAEHRHLVTLASEAGEVSASYADGGVGASIPRLMTPPPAARSPPHAERGEEDLLLDPERVGLVEPDISARIPGVVALLGHVAHLGADHDGLANAVHRADREHLVGVALQDLL